MTRGVTTEDLSIRIAADVKARARAAVFALRGTDEAIGGGVSGLVERLLSRELTRLEKRHNDGGPFPIVEKLPRGPGI